MPIKFSGPLLLIVEGPEDRLFFKRLIAEHNLPHFKVIDTGLNSEKGGITKFGSALHALRLSVASFNAVSHIVIVADNDDNPAENFLSIQQQLISKKFGVPDSPMTRTTGRPTIEIIMLPLGNNRGNLESVACALACNGKIATDVRTFEANTLCDKWPDEVRAKMWVRSYLAAACRRDPCVPLGTSFEDPVHAGLFDFQHSSLTPIVQLLAAY